MKLAIVIGDSGKLGSVIRNSLLDTDCYVIGLSRSTPQPLHIEDNCKYKHVDIDAGDEESIRTFLYSLDLSSIEYMTLVNCSSDRPNLGCTMPSPSNWHSSVSSASKVLYTPCYFFAELAKQKRIKSTIIFIGSIYGSIAPRFNIYNSTPLTTESDYSFIKHAEVGLMRFLASYYGPHGISSNLIRAGGFLSNQPEIFIRQYCDIVPLGRMANSRDLSSIIKFLSDPCSGYINGAEIALDGGLTCT